MICAILLLLLLTPLPINAVLAPRRPLKIVPHSASTRSKRKLPAPSQKKHSAARHASPSAGRFQSRRLVHVDPVSRLDTISSITTALSRGNSALSFPNALTGFFSALAIHQDDPAADTVRALQFGDSHTAADMFTGEARRVLQRQFGNGSVGFSYAGHPFAGYRILGSQRTQSGGWQTLGTHFSDLGDARLGLGGVAISTDRPGEFITLDAPCTTLELDYLQQPGGGNLRLTDDGALISEFSTDAPNPGPGTFRYTCPESTEASAAGTAPEPDHHFVVTTEASPLPGSPFNAPVRLFGLTALQPGVTWESLGINGAVAPLILRWDASLYTPYLHSTAANLIVLAYGTNEAAARSDPETYTASFTRIVEEIHATLPRTSILVLGPTDRAIAQRRRGFTPFAGTDPILDAQREVCRTHNCAFWDQRRRMGGFGAMQRWVYAGWAQPDHTHLTGEGYRALADSLMADLLSSYDSYRKAHGLPITTNPVAQTSTQTSAQTSAQTSNRITSRTSTPAANTRNDF